MEPLLEFFFMECNEIKKTTGDSTVRQSENAQIGLQLSAMGFGIVWLKLKND